MKKRFSAPNLFLLELLIVLLIFALSAAVCVRLFVSARLTASESRALNHAVLLCESGAECFKAANGDIAKAPTFWIGNIPMARPWPTSMRIGRAWQ